MLDDKLPQNIRGTFRGLQENIQYFVDLGITAVQLLPIFDFNESRLDLGVVENHGQIGNYWGYQPIGYFTFNPHYASSYGVGGLYEFKSMVKEFHKHSIKL